MRTLQRVAISRLRERFERVMGDDNVTVEVTVSDPDEHETIQVLAMRLPKPEIAGTALAWAIEMSTRSRAQIFVGKRGGLRAVNKNGRVVRGPRAFNVAMES